MERNDKKRGRQAPRPGRRSPEKPKRTASPAAIPVPVAGSHGSEQRSPGETIPAVLLPEGYRGKILLVLITLGEESLVALRSGDLWHREILRNTQAEVSNLGLKGARVHELGGASLFFEADGSIRICGGSDEFGACDLEYAAALVRAARPGRRVIVSAGEMA
jgi:hypothetical protein